MTNKSNSKYRFRNNLDGYGIICLGMICFSLLALGTFMLYPLVEVLSR